MAKKRPVGKLKVENDPITGQSALRWSHRLVFQDPASKDFMAWQGPSVREMVSDAATQAMLAEMEEHKAITIRTKVQDVELLDQFAKLLGKSRNEVASEFLGAALREALATLPDPMRERVQVAAFNKLGWAVARSMPAPGQSAPLPQGEQPTGGTASEAETSKE